MVSTSVCILLGAARAGTTPLLSMIMHDWSEEKDRELLRKCYAALPGGGAVIISELLVNDDKSGPASAALMSLNMLLETERRNYTPAEYALWPGDGGFRYIGTVWFEAAGANGAVVGRKLSMIMFICQLADLLAERQGAASVSDAISPPPTLSARRSLTYGGPLDQAAHNRKS